MDIVLEIMFNSLLLINNCAELVLKEILFGKFLLLSLMLKMLIINSNLGLILGGEEQFLLMTNINLLELMIYGGKEIGKMLT